MLRGGEAIVAAGATGVGQAVERFGFHNAELAAASKWSSAAHAASNHRQTRRRGAADRQGRPAGSGGREGCRPRHIETFAVEQAAAKGGELVPLLAEAGAQSVEAAAAEAAGGGILAAAGGAAAEGAGAAAAAAFPIAEGLGMAAGGAAALAGGAAYGLCQGGRWLLSGKRQ